MHLSETIHSHSSKTRDVVILRDLRVDSQSFGGKKRLEIETGMESKPS